MKKFLYVLTIALGTCFAANAQSTQKSEEVTTTETNVEVKVAGQDVQNGTLETETTTKSESKAACCSSKKGKKTASASGKACCADGKKSDAHCGEKKHRADAATPKSDNE